MFCFIKWLNGCTFGLQDELFFLNKAYDKKYELKESKQKGNQVEAGITRQKSLVVVAKAGVLAA